MEMMKHEVSNDSEGKAFITLLEGPFKGVSFTYGKVEVKEPEEDGSATLSFEYNILNGVEEGNKEFETVIGDLLTQLITIGLEKRDIVYTGGTDTN